MIVRLCGLNKKVYCTRCGSRASVCPPLLLKESKICSHPLDEFKLNYARSQSTELKPLILEANQHCVSHKEAPAKGKARWGKDTIWAIPSYPWNHEFSVPSTSSWPESAAVVVKAGTETDDATRLGVKAFRWKRIPALDLSLTAVRREGVCTCHMTPPLSFPDWPTSARRSGQQPPWADRLPCGPRRCLCSNGWNGRSRQLRTAGLRTHLDLLALTFVK